MKDNKHDQAIPVDIIAQVQAKIDEAQALLAPYILALTPGERQELPKMGEKTVSFVEKAHDLAKKNPDLTSRHFDMDAFEIDFADAHGLGVLASSIRQLETNVNDTRMVSGSEAYQAALSFYKSVKAAVEDNIPGAKPIYEELKLRFPRIKRRPANEEA